MSRAHRGEEAMKIAAERLRRKKEQEEKEEKEFYKRITSGPQWLLFKIVVVFCTVMAVLTTIDVLVDGETKKLDESEWKIDRSLYAMFHQSIVVEGYLFAPHLDDWSDAIDDSYAITYSPIFKTGKKLSYDLKTGENSVRRHTTIRRRSIFTWFPYLQIIMLIPFLTYVFRRQKPWFNFARVGSMIIIFPGIVLLTILTLL